LFMHTVLSCMLTFILSIFIFVFNDTSTPEIYTLSLHDALPISRSYCLPGKPGGADCELATRARPAAQPLPPAHRPAADRSRRGEEGVEFTQAGQAHRRRARRRALPGAAPHDRRAAALDRRQQQSAGTYHPGAV